MSHIRVAILAGLTLALAVAGPAPAQPAKLRFGVGPLQPTPAETTKAYDPFFAHLAKKLGRNYDLVATTDWAGISVALANGQVDVAYKMIEDAGVLVGRIKKKS